MIFQPVEFMRALRVRSFESRFRVITLLFLRRVPGQKHFPASCAEATPWRRRVGSLLSAAKKSVQLFFKKISAPRITRIARMVKAKKKPIHCKQVSSG
jgi:hypothetical protein